MGEAGAGEDRDDLSGCRGEWMAERRSRRASLFSLQLLVWAIAPLVLEALLWRKEWAS